MILMHVFANTVSLEVDKNKRTDKKSFGDHDKKSGQIFTLTITPKIGPNDTIEEVVNKAHGSVIILMPEGSGANGSVTFQAIEVDTSAGYFNMVTTGKVKEGKKPTGTQKGSTSNGDWDFTGTGTGSLNCDNKLTERTLLLQFHVSIDSLREKGCKIDKKHGSFSFPISETNTLANMIAKAKESLCFINKEGNNIYECGMFTLDSNIKEMVTDHASDSKCLKCSDKLFYKSVTFEYPYITPVIYVANWLESDSAGTITKSLYNKFIKEIISHENIHFEDFLSLYKKYLEPIKYEKLSCKKADLINYDKLRLNNHTDIFYKEFQKQKTYYERFLDDFNYFSEEYVEHVDPLSSFSDIEKSTPLTK